MHAGMMEDMRVPKYPSLIREEGLKCVPRPLRSAISLSSSLARRSARLALSHRAFRATVENQENVSC
jgi:hypothetical protein